MKNAILGPLAQVRKVKITLPQALGSLGMVIRDSLLGAKALTCTLYHLNICLNYFL